MKYKLKSGRVVEDGDYVQVKLTPRMINFFKELGVLQEYKDDFIDDLMNLLKFAR